VVFPAFCLFGTDAAGLNVCATLVVNTPMNKLSLLLASVGSAVIVLGSDAADFTARLADQEPPKELGEAIRQMLQPKAVQVLDGGKPAFEFWFAKEISLKSKPASPATVLDSLEQATLLGAVAVSADTRDYRNDELPAGIYTARFALQPQDGDHSGSSDYVYFAVLVPAALDPKPDSLTTYRAVVKASAKNTSTGHPYVLSLRPASSEAGDSPQIKEPAPEHKSVLLKLPAKAGEEKTSLTFELVCEGHIKK
jgi:hypothetical protein